MNGATIRQLMLALDGWLEATGRKPDGVTRSELDSLKERYPDGA